MIKRNGKLYNPAHVGAHVNQLGHAQRGVARGGEAPESYAQVEGQDNWRGRNNDKPLVHRKSNIGAQPYGTPHS